jgi:malic enzyme
MLVAAASALAAAAPAGQLLPDPLEPSIHERVSQAVQATVVRTGQAPARDGGSSERAAQ